MNPKSFNKRSHFLPLSLGLGLLGAAAIGTTSCSLKPYRYSADAKDGKVRVQLTPELEVRLKQGLHRSLSFAAANDASGSVAGSMSDNGENSSYSQHTCWAIYARAADSSVNATGSTADSSSAFDACNLNGISSSVSVIEAGSELVLDQLPAGTHTIEILEFYDPAQNCTSISSLNTWWDGHSTTTQNWLRYLWTLSDEDRATVLEDWSVNTLLSDYMPDGFADSLALKAYRFASFSVSGESTVELTYDESSLTPVAPACNTSTDAESTELGTSLAVALEHWESDYNSGSASDPSQGNFAGAGSICPDGYVGVPGNNALGTSSFCVMKMEARATGFVNALTPSAEPTSAPWINIKLSDARSACQNLQVVAGQTGIYDLISNLEWMTIARNIENTPSNWNTGTAGSGILNQGHSDGTPALALPITNLDDPFTGTGNTGLNGGAWGSQKRTHTLSTGSKIWDFAGNVYEWVIWDPFASPAVSRLTLAQRAYSSLDSGPVNAAREFLALDRLTSAADLMMPKTWQPAFTLLNSTNGFGTYRGGSNTVGSPIRGGHWADPSEAGIYNLSFEADPNIQYNHVGFRCVYRP